MRVLIIDNYDSFVYNIYQAIAELGCDVDIVRNDKIDVDLAISNYGRIVISPGPGNPKNESDFGVCKDVILKTGVPLLGVCLGHQGIGHCFGSRVVRLEPRHGKTSLVEHDGKGIFKGIENPLRVMRYHSLAVEPKSIPEELEVTAKSLDDGAVMGLRHRKKEIHGVQFHPESILAGEGKKIFENFIGEL